MSSHLSTITQMTSSWRARTCMSARPSAYLRSISSQQRICSSAVRIRRMADTRSSSRQDVVRTPGVALLDGLLAVGHDQELVVALLDLVRELDVVGQRQAAARFEGVHLTQPLRLVVPGEALADLHLGGRLVAVRQIVQLPVLDAVVAADDGAVRQLQRVADLRERLFE